MPNMGFWDWDFDLEIKMGTVKVVDNLVKEFTTNSQNLTFNIPTNTLTVSKVGDGSILANGTFFYPLKGFSDAACLPAIRPKAQASG